MKNLKVIQEDVWRSTYLLVHDCDTNRLRKVVTTTLQCDHYEEPAACAACCSEFNGDDGAQVIVIYFPHWSEWDNTTKSSVLTHELLHATRMTLQHRGLGVMTEATEEAYCYLLQSLVEKSLNALPK